MEALEEEISDDEIRRGKELQELTDAHVKRLDELLLHKEEELMEV